MSIPEQTKKIDRFSLGFTMIELLVVIAIIGLLSSVIVAGVSVVQKKSRDGVRVTAIQQIAAALERYRSDSGRYPAADCSSAVSGPASGLTCLTTPKSYIDQIPADPISSRGICGYYYKTDASGSTYTIYAILENSGGSTTTFTCGGSPVTYNYSIINP